MAKLFSSLEYAAKSHLYYLITDAGYRKKAFKSNYSADQGKNRPGVPVTKYGYTREKASSSDEYKEGKGEQPGAKRLAHCSKGWYLMEHSFADNNEYEYSKISFKGLYCSNKKCTNGKVISLEVCKICNGTGRKMYETDSTVHGGKRFIPSSRFVPCTCRKTKIQGLKPSEFGGVKSKNNDCPICKDYKVINNGERISISKIKWQVQ